MNNHTKTTWRKVKLGEIVVPKGSVSGPFGSNIHSKFFTREGVPVIRGNNLAIGFNPSRYVDDDYIFLSEEKAEELSKSEALPEDIIVTARGTIGQTGIIPKKSRYKKYILSANQLRFRIDRKIAKPLFVYYWLASKRMVRTMQNVSVNVGVPNLNLGSTRNLPVSLPPLPVQEQIADILSAFDDKIELNNKISRTLEQMAQVIFKEWFVKKDELPKEWATSTFGQLSKNFDSKRVPLSNMVRAKRQGNIPYYGAAGILDHIDKPLFDGEYLLIAEDGTVSDDNGRPILQFVEGKFWVNNHAHIIQGKDGVPTHFLYLFLKTISIMPYITGAVQLKLTQENLNSIPVMRPDKKTLDKYNQIVSPVFQKIRTVDSENKKLAALRDLLLPKLMSGEIRV